MTDRTASTYMRIAEVVPTLPAADRKRASDLSRRGLLRMLRVMADRHVVASTEIGPANLPAGRFETLIIDFPWPSTDWSVGPAGSSCTPYKTWTIAQITDWGRTTLQDMLADDSHVFFWTTHNWVTKFGPLLLAWDLEDAEEVFVWHKNGGPKPVGRAMRNSEFVVYARRGTPKFTSTK